MKKMITKLVIFALLAFSIIGFIATNPQVFKNMGINAESGQAGDSQSEEEGTNYKIESANDILEDEFYAKFRRLDTEAFLSHQVGKIGDTIFYTKLNNTQRWIRLESCEVIKELSDELIEAINKDARHGVDLGRIHYKEDALDLSEGRYAILKITYIVSPIGEADLPDIYSDGQYLYSCDEKMIYGEGTLIDSDNLQYVSYSGVSCEEYSDHFVFKNSEDNYFQMLYLVPDRILNEQRLYISGVQNDDYLLNAWKYDNSDYIFELNINE